MPSNLGPGATTTPGPARLNRFIRIARRAGVALLLPALASPTLSANPPCTCGGPRAFWGQPAPGEPERIGNLDFALVGGAHLRIRDPYGRRLTYEPASDEYRTDIPGASGGRGRLPGYGDELDDTDFGEDPADTQSTAPAEEALDDYAEVDGPACGDWLVELSAPRATRTMFSIRAYGLEFATDERYEDDTLAAGEIVRYRVHYDLAPDSLLRLERLAPGETVALRVPRTVAWMPCEPDSFEARRDADARIDVRGPGEPNLTVTLPEGRNYSVGSNWSIGGRGVGSGRDRGPWMTFHDTPRGEYQIELEAVASGGHVVRVAKTLPDGTTVVRTDSLRLAAGERRYWHANWSAPGRLAGRFLQLDRGPFGIPPVTLVSAQVIGIGEEPALSPDGRTLAFVRDDGLWRMDLASGARERLGAFAAPHWPAWHPDGTRLLLHAAAPGHPDGPPVIWSVRADGGAAHPIVRGNGEPDRFPLWSPRGDRIVWTRGKRLWIADSSGARARPLTRKPARVFERACEWRDDSAGVLFVASDGACDGPQYELRTVRPDGHSWRPTANGLRAEDARALRGRDAYLLTDGRRIIVAPSRPDREPNLLHLRAQVFGSQRTRLALAPDGGSAFVGADPGDQGEPVLVHFTIPARTSDALLARWREATLLLGADSSTVASDFGVPEVRAAGRQGEIRWSYRAGERHGAAAEWLRLDFRHGRLADATRDSTP